MYFASSRVPLAWLNLTHDKRRFVVSLAGVAFAVLLIFMELGFWNALVDSMVGLIRRMNADLVILHLNKYSFAFNEPFSRRRLSQAEAVEGVESARPLYIEYRGALWKNPEPEVHDGVPDPALSSIRVIAYDISQPMLDIPAVAEHSADLQKPDTVLFDARSRPAFGRREVGLHRELAGHQVEIVGTFSLGADFANDGSVILSEQNLARLFPSPDGSSPLSWVEVGLVKVVPGTDPRKVRHALRQTLPDDVVVLTLAEFIEGEKHFWQVSSPVGFVFGLGMVMGFIVGVVVCYQILSADVGDHLAEFATLKAIGYPDRYLSTVVLQEATILSLVGFAVGLGITVILYAMLRHTTGLPLELTFPRAGLVLVLTVGMCLASGLIAVRKVQQADPAEVF